MNYYDEIKNRLIDNEVYARIKDYSKERYKIRIYFEIGKLLTEAGGKYGDNIINDYSKKLVVEVGKQYNKRTLFRMKQFYNVFNNEKVSTLWTQLSWSHIRLLFSLSVDIINYYITTTVKNNLSVRELESRIKSKEYERLPLETKNKLISNDNLEVQDLVKNPIMIKNTSVQETFSETVLKQLILEDL